MGVKGSGEGPLKIEIGWYYCFEDWTFSLSPQSPSSLSCIKEYLVISCVHICMKYNDFVITLLLNRFGFVNAWVHTYKIPEPF